MIPIRKEILLVGGSTSSSRILTKISKKHTIQEMNREVGEEYYYDTFDWRLYRQKLFFTIHKNRQRLVKFDGTLLFSAPGLKMRKLFLQDIGEPEMQKFIGKYVQMRALCPTVAVTYDIRYFKILNRDRKTICWFEIKRNSARNGKADMELPESVTITSIRGYEKQYDKLLKTLSSLDLQKLSEETEIVDRAYGIMDRQPLDYGAKFHVGLTHRVTIGEAVSQICLDLVGSVETNYTGVCADVDSEFLHDFRIGVRRTRSLLSLLRKVLPQEQVRFFEEEFKWLGGVTGPVRDIDVYLLKRDHYQSLLPDALRPGLVLFFEELELQRKQELINLKKQLRSDRYRKLISSWHSFLTDEKSELFSGVRTKLCLNLVNRIINKRFDRFISDADQIDAQTPDELLHKLRIKGKKFRYLLEFFKSLYPSGDLNVFLKHMKKVQDNLGDFNDLSVQTEMLNNRLLGLKGRNKKTIQLAAALGSLISSLKHEHEQVRAQFQQTYGRFNTRENKQLMRQMTAATRPPSKAKKNQ